MKKIDIILSLVALVITPILMFYYWQDIGTSLNIWNKLVIMTWGLSFWIKIFSDLLEGK